MTKKGHELAEGDAYKVPGREYYQTVLAVTLSCVPRRVYVTYRVGEGEVYFIGDEYLEYDTAYEVFDPNRGPACKVVTVNTAEEAMELFRDG